jgi:predicted AlkP superfamily phosphohydrolase/phosphomutase
MRTQPIFPYTSHDVTIPLPALSGEELLVISFMPNLLSCKWRNWHMERSRVFVIGLDGGSWNVIDPLIERGKLPNLGRLKERGAWGELMSTLPPVTCPAWFTFSTGLRPSRLGIYDFRGIGRSSDHIRMHTYKEIRQPEFWDLLMESGKTCGIINNPLVYPLKRHRGYIVPGFITPQEDSRTYPEGLMGELDRVAGGYEIDQQAMTIVDDETLLKDCLRVLRKRIKAMTYLLREYPTDLFLGVFTETDRICHCFMNQALLSSGENGDRGWDALEQVFTLVDEGVGNILEMVGAEDFVIIMSDHGFEARPWNVHVNQWLVEEGLLRVKVVGGLEKIGLTQRGIGRLMKRIGLMELAYRVSPSKLREIMPAGETNMGEYFIHDLLEKGRVDWASTRAISMGYCSYLNTLDRPHGILSGPEAEDVKRQIAEGLQGLTDPQGGRGGIEFLDTGTAYGTETPMDPPDQMLRESGSWQIRSSLTRDGDLFTRNERAGHAMEGIFMLSHPWAKTGEISKPLGIEDLAPLILHLFGLPVPVEMDGCLRSDIFRSDTPLLDEAPVPRTEDGTAAEKERIRRRIAALRQSDAV